MKNEYIIITYIIYIYFYSLGIYLYYIAVSFVPIAVMQNVNYVK